MPAHSKPDPLLPLHSNPPFRRVVSFQTNRAVQAVTRCPACVGFMQFTCKMRTPAQKKRLFHGRPRICSLSGQVFFEAMRSSAQIPKLLLFAVTNLPLHFAPIHLCIHSTVCVPLPAPMFNAHRQLRALKSRSVRAFKKHCKKTTK